jgi:hypothetical protein
MTLQPTVRKLTPYFNAIARLQKIRASIDEELKKLCEEDELQPDSIVELRGNIASLLQNKERDLKARLENLYGISND